MMNLSHMGSDHFRSISNTSNIRNANIDDVFAMLLMLLMERKWSDPIQATATLLGFFGSTVTSMTFPGWYTGMSTWSIRHLVLTR